MNMVSCKCENCGKDFDRLEKEVKRGFRNGYRTCCSRSCSCSISNKLSPRKGDVSRLNAGNRQDEFSSFRYFVNKSKSTERVKSYGEPNVTVEYLKGLWETQDGRCPYTDKRMELPKNTRDHHIKGTPIKASLDRIDPSKGYVEGNVEFVCLAVNYAKNGFTKDEMLEFFGRKAV